MADTPIPDTPALDAAVITIDMVRGVEMLKKTLAPGDPRQRFRTGMREALQNALDATLRRRQDLGSAAGPATPIDITITDSDVTVRDYGIGLRPDQISSLILRIYGSGKDSGAGGFGAGAISVLLAAPDVQFRSRQLDHPGVEFRQSWLGQRPRVWEAEETAAFPVGTEVTFREVIQRQPATYTDVSREIAETAIAELVRTSAFPSEVEVRINGQPVVPTWTLDTSTRRLDADVQTTFPGALVEYHVVVLPDEKDPRYDARVHRPRTYFQLHDPEAGAWALTQWHEFLDDAVPFSLVVRIRPLVRPEHQDYPFNPERAGIPRDQIREAIDTMRRRLVTDRETAIRQQTWRKTFYLPDTPPADAVDAALLRAAQSEDALAAQRDMLQVVTTMAPATREQFLRQHGEAVTAARGDVELVARAIAGQPTMTMRHTDYVAPRWAPRRFDPDDPASVERLAPLLVAIRMLGRLVRAELARGDRYPFTDASRAPHYGFIFSPTEEAMLATEETPRGMTERFVLVNPTSEALRQAQTPEAMCDMLVRRILHEHVHEAQSYHDERFTILYGVGEDRMANLRQACYAVFRSSRAWAAMRRFQNLPLRPLREAAGGPGLDAPTLEARLSAAHLGSEATAFVREVHRELLGAEEYDVTVEAIGDVLRQIDALLPTDERDRASVRELCTALGVRPLRAAPRWPDQAGPSPAFIRTQLALLEALRCDAGVRELVQLTSEDHLWREDQIERLSAGRCTPVDLVPIARDLSEMRWAYRGGYGVLRDAARRAAEGALPGEALAAARRGLPYPDDADAALLKGPRADILVIAGTLVHVGERVQDDRIVVTLSPGAIARYRDAWRQFLATKANPLPLVTRDLRAALQAERVATRRSRVERRLSNPEPEVPHLDLFPDACKTGRGSPGGG